MQFEKRAFWPSFFFLGALLSALLTSSLHGYIFWWGAIVFLVALVYSCRQPLPRTPLSLSLLFYAGLLLFNALFLSPTFEIKGIFFIFSLWLSFSAFSRLPISTSLLLARVALLVAVALVVWGLIQHLFEIGFLIKLGARANAIFYTPNTFASFLNLMLLPTLVLYLLKAPGDNRLLMVALLLFAGLLATQSKGGYLGLMTGALFFVVWQQLHKPGIDRNRVLKVLAGMAAVIVVMEILKLLISASGINTQDYTSRIVALVEKGDVGRPILYQVALDLLREDPWWGRGYFNFQYFFQRDQFGIYIGLAPKFVHNDYLQIWLETGIIGLLALLTLVATSLWTALRSQARITGGRLALTGALGAGVASVFAHAMVDFPLYPPAILLILGAALGTLNRVTADARGSPALFGPIHRWMERIQFRPGVAERFVLMLLVLWLAQPVVSQLLMGKAKAMLIARETGGALKLMQIARATSPWDPDYYWEEGKLWMLAAIADNNRELAARADQLFQSGAQIHPYEFHNRLQRLILHRDHSGLLGKPVDDKVLHQWADQLLHWRPHVPAVQLEVINTYQRLGLGDKVAHEVSRFQQEKPKLNLIEQDSGLYRLQAKEADK